MSEDITNSPANHVEEPVMTFAQAVREARRCLHCKVPQCRKGCPVNNDIPEWIHELSMGNIGRAMEIINLRSNLPAVCGRVCAHERQCEGNCVLGKKGQHIRIGQLERFVADFEASLGLCRNSVAVKDRGNVAVVGSGPAGLTAAGELARKGFAVEIFEMEREPGGVLTFGIPEYRLPKDVVRREIKKIEQLGVTIHCTTAVGRRGYTIDDLFEKGFDAIFLATGTGKPRKLEVEGNRLPGVKHAVHFLRKLGLYQAGYISRDEVPVHPGDRVYVVGGGNTAMDAARSALKMGASSVTVVYHRDEANLSALRAEYEDAVAEGVKFQWLTDIQRFLGKDNTLTGFEAMTPEGMETFEADVVLTAIGAAPAARIINTSEGIEVDERGYVKTREMPYGMSTRKGVFAGGDVTNRPASVVHAMQDARKVSAGIEQYISALKLMQMLD